MPGPTPDLSNLPGFNPALGGVLPRPFDPYLDASDRMARTGPCEAWTTVDEVAACDPDAAASPFIDWAIDFASFVMWAASGRQYGLCRHVRRPHLTTACGRHDQWSLLDGQWTYRPGTCAPHRLRLPGLIAAVEAVVIDGEVIGPDRIGVDANRRDIFRLDGTRWPSSNDLTRNPTDQWPPYLRAECEPALPTVTTEVGTVRTLDGDCPTWVAQYLDHVGWEPTTTTSGVAEIESIVRSGTVSAWVAEALSNGDLGYAVIDRRERPQWLTEWLLDAGLDIAVVSSNTCHICCDPATGHRRDANGLQYVCIHGVVPTKSNPSVRVIPGGCGGCGTQTIERDNCLAGCQAVLVPAVGCDMTQPVVELTADATYLAANTWGAEALLAAGLDGCGPLFSITSTTPAEGCKTSEWIRGCVGRSTPRPVPANTGQWSIDQNDPAFTAADIATANVPSTCGPAWEVRYWTGRPIDAHVRGLAAMLAAQVVAARCNSGDCTLGQGLVSLARAGTTLTFNNPKDRAAIAGLYTGLDPVDLWLKAENPKGRRRRTRIIRADDPNRRNVWGWT